MNIHDVRKKYFDFFAKHGHTIVPAASLVPENDPTTLFTGSGMQPMVPYLLGEEHPLGKRIADSQICFRTQDIDEVGDNRHTTFFEMLGNWSLGDYFKKEQIEWVFEFLTKEIGLDPGRLSVTVFAGNDKFGIPRDTESFEFWKTKLPQERIFFYDEKKNWWSRSGIPENMPVGEPGGPDSEIFWDFGAYLKLHENSPQNDRQCHVNCDCGRYLELGNNVFMQYKKTENGFELLPNKNVDFGGGLERITAALQDTVDIFLLDVFGKPRTKLEQLSGRTYDSFSEYAKSFRVILDHLRAVVFLIANSVIPSNKDQGYFARRLIRRAVRFGKKIGIKEPFCEKIGESFIETYQEPYPHLVKNKQIILKALYEEEKKFLKTLSNGEKEFEKLFTQHNGISGDNAFILYTTFGFPLELIEEMVEEKGQHIDRKTFSNEFKKHQELSRSGSAEKFTGGLADHSRETVKLHTATHMLNQALRMVLGDHVFQKGSNITHQRLRFDFSHTKRLTDEQIKQVEKIVNENIKKKLPIHFEVLDMDEAKKIGAFGVFEDKYAQLGGKIKVYFIGDFSKEVCGGPHVENTVELGQFEIQKDESIGSGIRRIKAVLI